MPIVKYPYLHLTDWPFRVDPDESFYRFMADRDQVRQDVEKLLHNLSRRSPSSIHLMWAWFGAGKTHTLRHLEYLSKEHYKCFLTVYTDFPRSAKGFLDLYKLFIEHVDLDRIRMSFEEIYTHKDGGPFLRKLQLSFPDLSLAMKKFLGAPEAEQDTCIRWLRAESVDKKTLKSIGLNKSISSSDEAINVISWFVAVLNAASTLTQQPGTRLIWILDEYQRIKDCRPPVRSEINTALHSVFTRCPNFLSFIITFSGRPEEKKWPEWLSPEIRDRIGVIANVLLLPPLGPTDATRFVREILAFLRPQGTAEKDSFFPFTEECVHQILKLMHQKHVELKPRSIMQFFNAVLEEAETDIEKGELDEVTPKFAETVLKNYQYREAERE